MPSKTSSLPEAISGSIPKIFDQAQNTTANHQKNVVALHKIHCDAATFTEPVHNGKSIKLTGERLFEDAFIGMLCRVLVVKKGIPQADRIVKFTGAYTKYMNEKAIANDDDDTTASRFVVRLLKFLLSGFVAKDKIVRYRCVRILAEIVAHLGEIECVVSGYSDIDSDYFLQRGCLHDTPLSSSRTYPRQRNTHSRSSSCRSF